MAHLRRLTLDESERRNYTEGATRAYLQIIEDLARYFHRSPDQLGPEHLREYTAHLPWPETLRQLGQSDRRCASLFLSLGSETLLDRRRNALPEEEIHLPVIWSPEEVACLIDARADSVLPHHSHDPLWHWRAPRRV